MRLYQEWADEAAFTRHREAPEFAALRGTLGPHLNGPPVTRVFEAVAREG